jgi:hypothetical protein
VEFEKFSHRHAEALLNSVPEYQPLWQDLALKLEGITEEMLISHFKTNYEGKKKQTMSLSKSINELIKSELGALTPAELKKQKLSDENRWVAESQIFGESIFGLSKWRLDFARKVWTADDSGLKANKILEKGISIEVAFNNAGSAAWNLLKPSIASELNHVKKNIQTSIGILIVASHDMKVQGGFDKTVGTFDSYKAMLDPLQDVIKVPMLVIGLKAPKTFKIEVYKRDGKNHGRVKML